MFCIAEISVFTVHKVVEIVMCKRCDFRRRTRYRAGK